MGSIPTWVQVVGACFALVAIAATAFAIASSHWFRTKDDVKQRMIDDYKERNTQLELDNDRKDAELIAEKNAREAIERIKVGHPELTEIKRLLRAHDTDTVERLNAVHKILLDEGSKS